jgi:hypothetical protein
VGARERPRASHPHAALVAARRADAARRAALGPERVLAAEEEGEAHSRRARQQRQGRLRHSRHGAPPVRHAQGQLPRRQQGLVDLLLAEFQDDASFDKSDLAYFDQQTGEASSHVDHIVGPYSPGVPDAESLLDVELASTLALNSTYWFWTVTGWMYEFSTDLFKRKDGPHVVSMSWGWSSSDQCSITSCNGTTSRQYIERVDTEFNKITATGVTLLAASGDQGAPGDAHGDSCDGLGTIYPGASQWVTSVGATMLDERSKPSPPPPPPYKAPPVCSQFPCSNVMYEMACSIPTALITTGGGFNIYTLRPNWQNNAVLEYLNSSVKFPPQHMWHSANRGFPDVSAVGHAILIADQGQMEQVDGTSASSPIVASMVALWNGYRLNNKKSTLGFINPALYKAWEKDKAAFKPPSTATTSARRIAAATTVTSRTRTAGRRSRASAPSASRISSTTLRRCREDSNERTINSPIQEQPHLIDVDVDVIALISFDR